MLVEYQSSYAGEISPATLAPRPFGGSGPIISFSPSAPFPKISVSTNRFQFIPKIIGTNRFLEIPRTNFPGPGVYKTEPFTCIVIVPGATPDDQMARAGARNIDNMSIIGPGLQFVPWSGK